MNAIPPGGLTPEEPLVRPSAARRGAKPAAGADQVQLMVALEEDSAEATGMVMLEDSDDAPAHEQLDPAEASHDRTDEPIRLEDEPETASVSQQLPPDTGVDEPAANVHDAIVHRAAQPIAPAEHLGSAPADIHAHQAAPTQSGQIRAEAERESERRPATLGDASDPMTTAHLAAARRPGPQPAALLHPEASTRPTQWADAPAADTRPEAWQPDNSRGRAESATGRSEPWPGSRAAPEAAATAPSGWDRPPPPPRSASRAAAVPTASLGMPAQLSSIEVTLSVEIGSHRLPLRDLLSVEPGQLVPLDRMTSEPVDILVNGKPFARGEVVAIGDRFGIRLTELVDANDPR